ncbi:MAG: hypothetical protein ACI8ZB_002083 [Desulforhopalus sp.]|jgi:uncharacterized protein involved in outer membrane biogenesis
MKKLLRWAIRMVVGLLVLVVLILSTIIIFKIPLNLTPYKEPVELLLSKGMNRNIRIEKSVTVSTSLAPYFTIEGLVIENPKGFEASTFLAMDLAKIQIELLPLLKKKFYISEFRVQGLQLSLEENKAGTVNWIFTTDDVTKTEQPRRRDDKKTPSDVQKPIEFTNDSLVVRNIDLQDIKVSFNSQNLVKPAYMQLEKCLGNMLPGEPLNLATNGNVSGFDYTLDISLGSLEELLLNNRTWIEVQADIAETRLSFSGNVDSSTAIKSLLLKARVEGDDFSSLNDLLQLDLPPLKSYELETNLHLRPNEYELQKMIIKTGSSSLIGVASVLKSDESTKVDVKLTSEVIQLDDFLFDNWSWFEDESVDESTDKADQTVKKGKRKTVEDKEATPENSRIIDGKLLAGLEVHLDIESKKVLSGEDELGGSRLLGTIDDGRIKIDPLMIQLPGGKIEMMASFKPGAEKSEADLIIDIENFDIGVFVRRSKPESDMGGLVNLDVNLHSTAATIPQMLKNGNGYFDFSGNLENFGAGVINLWAVNLVAAIVSNAEKQKSQLNCAVGRWSATDGVLHSDVFFIDTDKIRICAEGTVNLKDERIDIKVKPKAKKAQFFSLATPLEVHGSFTDINVGIGRGGVLGTAIQFIASPVSAPIKRTFTAKIPKDGSDVCNMELGPRRSGVDVPMCSE